ncbi:MAG: TIGR00730 family Rossman fold protein [Vicinamibacteraceae bacterium]|nr:TIGR00730 family Rossman fold protein [Vicinamibacteraceae bacterium]
MGADPAFAEMAHRLGETLGRRGFGLVYGGASVGLMGIVADAALAAGAHVIGVIPTSLVNREIAHTRLHDLRVVRTMHERKAMMVELADAFVVLPGALGTLDETFEMLTWAQLGIHDKPIGLLDVSGYYGPLLAFLDRSVAAGLMRVEHRSLLQVGHDPEDLLDRFASHEPVAVPKWAAEADT